MAIYNFCNCSYQKDYSNRSDLECLREFKKAIRYVNHQLWVETKSHPDYLLTADIYTVIMLGLFASIISLLMIRAIKPSESTDDNVAVLLNSMRVRVEYEENVRQRRKLKEAKQRAQRWLTELKERSVKRLSFRSRTSSVLSSRTPQISEGSKTPRLSEGSKTPRLSEGSKTPQLSEKLSMKSNPPPIRCTTPVSVSQQRAASYQFLPEIVVTTFRHEDMVDDSTPSSRPLSRSSTSESDDEASQDGLQDGSVFNEEV